MVQNSLKFVTDRTCEIDKMKGSPSLYYDNVTILRRHIGYPLRAHFPLSNSISVRETRKSRPTHRVDFPTPSCEVIFGVLENMRQTPCNPQISSVINLATLACTLLFSLNTNSASATRLETAIKTKVSPPTK